jgi:two-component system chemotaxis sensor kinase CheA
MTTSRPPERTTAAIELLRRAALETVMVQPSIPGALARLAATLDALCEAYAGTDCGELAEKARSALPDDGTKVTQDALDAAGAALDEIANRIERTERPNSTSSVASADDLVWDDSDARETTSDADVGATSGEAADSSSRVARDAETIELFIDFVAEGEDGLARVDEILLGADQGSVGDERVNELFRVFHTIKGVSGFLEATEVTRLAHVTETLLDGVRSHRLTLSGSVLEAVFEASACMRSLLKGVRESVKANRAVTPLVSLPRVVAQVERAELQPNESLGADRNATRIAGAKEPELAEATPADAPLPTTEDDGEARPTTPEATVDRAGPVRVRETVKVDLERIDSVVEMIGELIIVESMVVNAPEVATLPSLKIRNYLAQLTKISRDLQSVTMRMRMIPVRGVFQKMARLTRDLSRKTGKPVQFIQSGEGCEMDRSMVERIEEPLVHMIRNAMDHAIESAEERRALGKPEVATIRLSAHHEGGSIALEISDDGRGLRRDAILAKARERGLVGESKAQLSDEEVYALIFQPGFSTAARVSELSGRGVGMDVVKRSIEGMRGRIVTRSTSSVGTTFKLVLPLTLAIIDGLLVSCGGETYIIPSLAIVESLQVSPGMLRTLGQRGELLDMRGEILSLIRLRRLFGVEGPEPLPEESRVVVIESAGKKIGLMVDEVVTEQQIVIKPLSSGLGDTDLLAGAAILSDGKVGLILNVDRLGNELGGLRRRHHEQIEAAP